MTVLFPMCAMALLTIVVLPFTLFGRIKAVRSGKVGINYFRTFQGEDAPERIVRNARHLANLFEVPVLFYVACLTIMVQGLDDSLFLTLAWGYFSLRFCHSLVHLSYNKVEHRVVPFVISNIVLVVMFVRIIIKSV